MPNPINHRMVDLQRATRRAPSGKTVQVIVRLSHQGEMQANEEMQASFMNRSAKLAGRMKEIGRVKHVLNAVFLEVDRELLPTLAKDPAVVRIAEVANYELDLADTVPYIGGTVLHAQGFDGTGVRVAVIDSGIDYLHANLGGSGDPAQFEANDPTVIEPGTFPTGRVVGGYDFVGQTWPNGPLAPDPDPLDHGGHGTHVADIIGGNDGVAPGVSLYALQVCSAVASSCSGVALIQAMDFAVDPNGDGDTSDHVDVINMSLGSNYGQPFDDDLVLAVENATALGVLTVASAGNGGDRPYITGTPAAARSALSVAQTAVPTEQLNFITITYPAPGDHLAVHQPWSGPQNTTITGPVQYGDGAGGNLDGCAAFAPGSLTGEIVFVNRGVCSFSVKIQNIEAAGGILGIIGLIAPGEPFAGGFGGGVPPVIPAYMVSQATGDILRLGTAIVSIDPNNTLPLVMSMVSSSSRGPRNGDNMIKPEIGAPGGSVSAVAGSGTGVTAFSGTSGASPMVAGSAALLMHARASEIASAGVPRPLLVKSMLMNYAEEDIRRDFTGVLAEITRIGSGEVRIDDSSDGLAVAWSVEDGAAGVSLGHSDVSNRETFTREIRVKNFTNHVLHYDIETSFRFADDEASGAVEIRAPSSIRIPRHGTRDFTVRFIVKGQQLAGNPMSSGSDGANPATLTAAEMDGLITLDDGANPLHLPWQVIPRQAADVHPDDTQLDFDGTRARIRLNNVGRGVAQNEAFTLIGLSGDIPSGGIGQQSPTPDLRAVGVNTVHVPAGVCSATESFVWSFAVTTQERQTHVLPVIHAIDLDIDRDGTFDYEIANIDLGWVQTQTLDGRNVVWSTDLATGAADAFFFTEHATNTANTVLRVCAEQLGLSVADLGTRQIDAAVFALDFYFGGPGDEITGLTVTPGGERFFFEVDATIAARTRGALVANDLGPTLNSPELGALLFTNSDFGAGARGGAVSESEALIFALPGVPIP